VFFLALLFGFFAFKQTGMARKALYLVRYGQPEDCILEIRKESGDDRDYVKGRVYRVSKEKWDISFAPPLWNVDPVLQKKLHAKVYFEPETEYPLVVMTQGGHLWAERVPARKNLPQQAAFLNQMLLRKLPANEPFSFSAKDTCIQ
jgi:hypothetical protein